MQTLSHSFLQGSWRDYFVGSVPLTRDESPDWDACEPVHYRCARLVPRTGSPRALCLLLMHRHRLKMLVIEQGSTD